MKRKTQLVVLTIVLVLFITTSVTTVVGHANNPSEIPMISPEGDGGDDQSCGIVDTNQDNELDT